VVPAGVRRVNAGVHRTDKFITQFSQLALYPYTSQQLIKDISLIKFITASIITFE